MCGAVVLPLPAVSLPFNIAQRTLNAHVHIFSHETNEYRVIRRPRRVCAQKNVIANANISANSRRCAKWASLSTSRGCATCAYVCEHTQRPTPSTTPKSGTRGNYLQIFTRSTPNAESECSLLCGAVCMHSNHWRRRAMMRWICNVWIVPARISGAFRSVRRVSRRRHPALLILLTHRIASHCIAFRSSNCILCMMLNSRPPDS